MPMIGTYPCCNGSLMIELPDGELPRFGRAQCPHCGAAVWHRYSRAAGVTWTEADFLADFDVDEEAMTITPKGLP